MKKKTKNPKGIIKITFQADEKPNHTFLTFIGNVKVWITALTPVDPTLNEYRVSYIDGVVRYFLLDEFMGTPFECLIPEIRKLTKVDEEDIRIIDGEFYCKKN